MDQKILNLTDSNFLDYISKFDNINSSSSVFLIDFWAPWCNPCKMLAPIIKEVAIEFCNKIKFAKLNIDENPLITKKYGIKSIPTLLLIKDGIVLSTKVGLLSKSQLIDFINTYI